MGREVSAIAAPRRHDADAGVGARAPGRRTLQPRGASRGDIEAALPRVEVIDEDALVDEPRAPKYVRKADPRFYRLRQSDRCAATAFAAPMSRN